SNPEDAQYSEVQSQNTAQFHLAMKKGANTEKLIKQIEKQQEEYPESEFDIIQMSLVSFNNSTITLDIVGEESEQLLKVSELVSKTVEEIDGVKRVKSNQNS